MDTVFERNWEDLPPELVHLFAKKLPEISDFIHLRAICKTWRSTISISDLPPQFPWIMKESNGPDQEFYSLHASNKVTIHAPNSSNKYVQGPAGGYVLALAHQDGNTAHFSLLNPIKNSEVCLPVLDASHSDIHWISSPGFRSNDYVVVMDGNCTLYTCKAGDDKWDCIKWDCTGHWNCWEGIYYLKKSLLFMAERSKAWATKVMDIDSHEELYVIPPPEDENSSECYPYIFECGEDILRVCGYWVRDLEVTDNVIFYCDFRIYRLEFGNGKGQPCWVKIRSIDDQILFFGDRGFFLRANDFPGIKGNCIYYLRKEYNDRIPSIGIYDIENGSTVFVNCPFGYKDDISWFIPTLN